MSKTFYIDFGRGPVECIQDSGAEISVVKPHMIGPKLMHKPSACTAVTSSSAFGNQVKAKLCNVDAQLYDKNNLTSNHTRALLTCAVTDELLRDVALISSLDYETLVEAHEEFIPQVTFLRNTLVITDDSSYCTSNSIKLETVTVNQTDLVAVQRGEKLKSLILKP
jgi:hypothetical protein